MLDLFQPLKMSGILLRTSRPVMREENLVGDLKRGSLKVASFSLLNILFLTRESLNRGAHEETTQFQAQEYDPEDDSGEKIRW